MDKFLKFGLVALFFASAIPLASAGLEFRVTYREQASQGDKKDNESDLWTLELAGAGDKTANIENVTIELANSNQYYGRKYFDTTPEDGTGIEDAFNFAFVESTGLHNSEVSYEVTDWNGGTNNRLSIDFASDAGFNQAGDKYLFSLDVDNTDATVWGEGLVNAGAWLTLTYNGGETQRSQFYVTSEQVYLPEAYANVTVAPLPGSLLLCGIGLGFMGVVRRFRKK